MPPYQRGHTARVYSHRIPEPFVRGGGQHLARPLGAIVRSPDNGYAIVAAHADRANRDPPAIDRCHVARTPHRRPRPPPPLATVGRITESGTAFCRRSGRQQPMRARRNLMDVRDRLRRLLLPPLAGLGPPDGTSAAAPVVRAHRPCHDEAAISRDGIHRLRAAKPRTVVGRHAPGSTVVGQRDQSARVSPSTRPTATTRLSDDATALKNPAPASGNVTSSAHDSSSATGLAAPTATEAIPCRSEPASQPSDVADGAGGRKTMKPPTTNTAATTTATATRWRDVRIEPSILLGAAFNRRPAAGLSESGRALPSKMIVE
jgi:hypothetical protein